MFFFLIKKFGQHGDFISTILVVIKFGIRDVRGGGG